jgi:hypothetical protein
MITLSTHFSNDGKARADVVLTGKKIKVVCKVNGIERVRVGVQSAASLDAAEDFAEDFVSKNYNKKVNDGNYAGEPAVLC